MTAMQTLGTLVLAGSGEYTPTMDIVDRHLIQRLGGRSVLLIATACAPEGEDVMDRWERMGAAHFQRHGVEATPVRIRDQHDANQPEHSERIAEAGLVWFSGGRATYLAEAFHDTLAWRALEAANRAGTIVAGSSGGLGVLNVHTHDPEIEGTQPPTGLGLAAPLRALPHFDRMEARRPEFLQRALRLVQPGQKVVGVDEDTALVWDDGGWHVMGHKRAVVFDQDGSRTIFHAGQQVDILPAPEREAAVSQ